MTIEAADRYPSAHDFRSGQHVPKVVKQTLQEMAEPGTGRSSTSS